MNTIDLYKLAESGFTDDQVCGCGELIQYRTYNDRDRMVYSLLIIHLDHAVEVDMQVQTFNAWPELQVADMVRESTQLVQFKNNCISRMAPNNQPGWAIPHSWSVHTYSYETPYAWDRILEQL